MQESETPNKLIKNSSMNFQKMCIYHFRTWQFIWNIFLIFHTMMKSRNTNLLSYLNVDFQFNVQYVCNCLMAEVNDKLYSYLLTKSGLISENFSRWLQSPKKCAKHYLEHLFFKVRIGIHIFWEIGPKETNFLRLSQLYLIQYVCCIFVLEIVVLYYVYCMYNLS
jgi:hypothetical protein